MKRIILSLAVFLFAAAAWGQVGIPPGVIFGNPTPGGSCLAGPGQIITATGTILTCQGASTSGGGKWAGAGVANALWHRLGVVVAPVASDPMDSGAGHIQEASVVISTSPELLTGYTKVKEYAFTSGWQPVASGGSGMSVCFGEAPDDTTQPTRYPSCIVNHARAYLGVDPTNGKYILSTVNMLTSVLDIYEANTMAALSALGSPTFANVISCGGNGNETSSTLGAGVPIYDSGNTRWRVFYACASNAVGALNGYADWLATGATLNALTKFQTAPVIGFGSTATAGGNCADCGISYVTYINGKLYAVGNGGPAGLTPTPYMYRFVDSTGIGNAWTTPDPPFFVADSFGEGMNNTLGQIGQPYLSPLLDGSGTVMNYTEYVNGCPNLHVCPYPSYALAASIPLPLETVLMSTTTGDASPLLSTQFQVNGVAASCGSVCNLTGGGVTDSGNSTIAIAGGGYVGSPPLTPSSAGVAGQYAVSAGNLYTYDATQSKWLLFGSTAWGATTGSYVQGAGSFSAGLTSTMTKTIGTVAAGDLIVTCASWTTSTTTFAVSDGTSSFTTIGRVTFVGSPDTTYTQCAYLLSANAGAVTYTVTWGSNVSNRELWVAEFHQSSGTWHFLTSAAGVNAPSTPSTASSSGSFTIGGLTSVVVMDTKLADVAATTSTPLIAGNAATEFASWSPIATNDHKYYLLNTSITTGTGNVTYGTATYWSNAVMAFSAY